MTLLDCVFIGGVALLAAGIVGVLGLLEGYFAARRDAAEIDRIIRDE